MSKHTPTPWTARWFYGTKEDQELQKVHGMALVPSLGNEGERFIVAGEGDNCKRVALVDCHTRFKRGQGHQAECEERDANAALICHRVNTYEELVEALRAVVARYGPDATYLESEVWNQARSALALAEPARAGEE